MQTPLQITFRHFPTSPALESDLRARVNDLEKIFDRITSCRVLVDAPHHHQRQGQLYRVRIEIHVPGETLVVARSPDAHPAHEDPYLAARDAFRAAHRQLEDYVCRCRGGAKADLNPL